MGVFGSSPPTEMSSNGTKTAPSQASPAASPQGRAPEPVRRRRRPGVVALGVALMALGGLSAGWLVVNAGQKSAVLALARPVSYGDRIDAADVVVAHVAADPSVRTVPASRRAAVVGQYAATTLPAGSLLSTKSLMPNVLPGAAFELVGVAVPRSGMPNLPLRPRQPVLITATPADGSEAAEESPSTVAATVVSVGPADAEGTRVVDVLVPAGQGPRVAALASAGQVALVVQPAGSGTGSGAGGGS